MVDWRSAKDWTPDIAEKVIATGYLRNIEDHTSEAQYGIDRRYEVLFDMMSMVSTSLLGMTFECARCHNHKYDPISQRDYYRLMATFESSYNIHNWLKPQQRWIPDVGPIARTKIDQHNAHIDAQIRALRGKLFDRVEVPVVPLTNEQIASLGDCHGGQPRVRAVRQAGTRPDRRNPLSRL